MATADVSSHVIQDPSFRSSYVSPKGINSDPKLHLESMSPSRSLPPRHMYPFLQQQYPAPRKLMPKDRNELAVFDAEKYFKGDDVVDGNREEKQRLGVLQSPRVLLYRSVTPSISSESSSANSQLALLRSRSSRAAGPMQRQSPEPNNSTRKTTAGQRRVVSVGCPCYGRRAVASADALTSHLEPRKPAIFDIRSGYPDSLSNPIVFRVPDPTDKIVKLPQELLLLRSASRLEAVAQKQSGNYQHLPLPSTINLPSPSPSPPQKINNGNHGMPPPASVDHLRPPKIDHKLQQQQLSQQETSFPLEDVGRRISDGRRPHLASRRMDMFANNTGPAGMLRDVEIDAASDASSDLFELEVVSSQVGSYLRRTVSGDMSSCYEPSEASIEWSVATASVAEFSDAAGNLVSGHGTGKGSRTLGLRPEQKRRSSLLAGCRSHAAVDVATNSSATLPVKSAAD